jgi:hypothetical protein
MSFATSKLRFLFFIVLTEEMEYTGDTSGDEARGWCLSLGLLGEPGRGGVDEAQNASPSSHMLLERS